MIPEDSTTLLKRIYFFNKEDFAKYLSKIIIEELVVNTVETNLIVKSRKINNGRAVIYKDNIVYEEITEEELKNTIIEIIKNTKIPDLPVINQVVNLNNPN